MSGKTREEETLVPAVRPVRFASIVAVIVLLDRAVKYQVHQALPVEGSAFYCIENVLHLTRVNNTGAAFGLLRDRTAPLALISAAGILFFLYYWHRRMNERPSRRVDIGSALVIAGTIGNLYDRVRYGYVLDYIDLRVWPVFNLADAAITIGIALLVMSLIGFPRRA